jgi:ribosomal protein L11 methyltransferase
MRFPSRLETISIEVPQAAVAWFERALQAACSSVAMFLDEATGRWRVEGIKQAGRGEDELQAGLLLAQWQTGIEPATTRNATPADGWLARTRSGFPEQRVGRRFVIRGSHLPHITVPGRITLRLDAGVAFGSGEHGSTQGCLLALERVAYRRPRRILDLGTGSGVLAMAASGLLRRRVLAADIDPWSVRVAKENARENGLSGMIDCVLANGWRNRRVRQAAPYDLVFANILARPLCAMATDLAAHLSPSGTAVLAGLLATQARQVAVAHRRAGLRLEAALHVGAWATLILRRSGTVGRRY